MAPFSLLTAELLAPRCAMKSAFFLAAVLLPSILLAHPGHEGGFAGLSHALGDVDHVWAIPAVAVLVAAGAVSFYLARRRSAQ